MIHVLIAKGDADGPLVPRTIVVQRPNLDIPTVTIAPGVHLPMVGLGTWQYNSSKVYEAVKSALAMGYPHIDTANDYKNQDGIGKAIKESGIAREDFFLTTKVEGGLTFEETTAEAEENLSLLGLDYVDLLLVHFPCDMKGKGSAEVRRAQWAAVEGQVRQGKARSIGVSHYCRRHLLDILETASIKPAVNQVQYHVGMGMSGVNATDDKPFYDMMGILYQSFSPLCGPCGTTELLDGPLVTGIGKKYNKTGAQVSLKWQVQQGIPVIPKSASATHQLENIDLFGWTLSDADMAALTKADSPAVAGGASAEDSGDCGIP